MLTEKKIVFFKAGLKVGDMLLAVNKDVTLESNYDEVCFFKIYNVMTNCISPSGCCIIETC